MTNIAKVFYNSIEEIIHKMVFSEIDKLEISKSEFSKKYDLGAGIFFKNNKGQAFIYFSEKTSKLIVQNMLGLDISEIDPKDFTDNIKEMLNMICGNVKSKFVNTEYYFELEIPYSINKETIISKNKCYEIVFYIKNEANYFQVAIT